MILCLNKCGLAVDLIYDDHNTIFCISFKIIIIMPTCVEGLQYARHSAKPITVIITFNPHNRP